MTNHGPDTSENVFELLELDLEKPAAKEPKQGPAITQAKPQTLSPLAAGCALVTACTTLTDLQGLAGRLNSTNHADGAWFKAQPTGTQDAIRVAWREQRRQLLQPLVELWPKLWAFLTTTQDDARAMERAMERMRLFDDARPEDVARYQARNPRPCDDCLPGRPCYRQDLRWTVAADVTPPADGWRAPSVPATWMPGDDMPAPVSIENTSTLVEALTNASTEGAANAAGAVSGSLADGTMRGVGFSTALGYVTALTNGVKAATAELYKNTLRTRFGYDAEDIAALTITIIPESALPVGAGVQVNHNTENLTPAQQRAAWRQPIQSDEKKAAEAKTKAETAEREAEEQRVLIAGLVETREGLCVSPGEAKKGYKVPASTFRSKLGAAFSHLAPRIKTDKAQFGEVMRGLKSAGLYAFAAVKKHTTGDWNADVVSRWIVGTLDTTTDMTKMGDKELVADLCRTTTDENGNKLTKPRYEIHFTGGEDYVRERVVAEFEKRVKEELLTTTYLATWFKRQVLAKEYHAIKWGGFWFVPGTEEQTKELQTLIELLTDEDEILGRDIGVGSTTTTDKWSRGVARTLVNDLRKIEQAFANNTRDSQERARAQAIEDQVDEAGQEIAARQAKASPEAARGRLKELEKLTTLIEGYKLLLGEQYDVTIGAVRTLRASIEECLDSTSLMAANIELDLDDDDGEPTSYADSDEDDAS